MNELPGSWIEVPLASVITGLGQGWSPKCDLNRPPNPEEWAIIKTTAIQHCRYDDTEAKPLPPALKPRPSIEIQDGDFLMTRKGPRLRAGVSCYVRHTRKRLMICDTVYRFRCVEEVTFPLYLEMALNSPEVLRAIDRHKAGINESGVSLTHQKLGSVEIPLPPLNEQKRIVAKIEELFSELDAGEESLRQARRQLGVYRQSLLKQAFEGKLTAQWRKQNPDLLESPDQLLTRIQAERKARYEEQQTEWKNAGGGQGRPKKPAHVIALSQSEVTQLNPLPAEWVWIPFSVVCDFFNGDRSKNYPNRSEYVPEGIAWINTGHIDPDGSLSTERMHFIRRDKFDSLSGGRIKPGDLVYCLRGATFGKTAFVSPFTEGAIASSLMIIRPTTTDTAPFIYRYLVSPLGKEQLQRFDNGSAQPNLSAASVALYHFPLCSLPEQQEIVRLLDEQFTVIEQNEREIAAALKRSEALRQSILKKAFTGHLIPQDPTDEPAKELLARIREEREAAAKQTKKKIAKQRTKP